MTRSASMTTHLFVWPGAEIPPTVPDGVRASPMPVTVRALKEALTEVVRDPSIAIVACWDTRLAPIPWLQLARFASSLDDAWHPGPCLSGTEDDLLRYVIPMWVNRPAPDGATAGAINWRLDLRACFLRAATLRAAGGLDGTFETFAGAARELGLRLVKSGAVIRQQPSLYAGPPAPELPSDADRYRLLIKRVSRKWPAYAFVRRVIDGASITREARAWWTAAGDRSVVRVEPNALQRPVESVTLPEAPTVSVVLPTYGRYRYLAEVLDDLRAQTVPPAQIIIADGNPPEERDHKLYERYRDLPIEVVWDDERGMCSARNACLRRAHGEYVWFVDDDSRFPADNLEMHLRVLAAYGADVSVGPAYTRGRPELHAEQREIACSFMDCGTTVCKKSLIDQVGGFDMQFNSLLPGEDGELGVRFVRAGGLMVNNPLAKRFHYLAPVGGGRRSSNNLHRWSRWSRLPRPVQTVYYTARRHFEAGVAWDAMLIASLAVGWRRRDEERATLRWRARTLLAEIAALPVTIYRLRESRRIAEEMLREGAQIPPIAAASRRAIKP